MKKAWGSTEAVTEGQNLGLTCSTTCALWPNPTYVWYKNGQPVPQRHQAYNNYLNLISVSREDSGNYSCAVKGKDNLISSSLPVDVRCMYTNSLSAVFKSNKCDENDMCFLHRSSRENFSIRMSSWWNIRGQLGDPGVQQWCQPTRAHIHLVPEDQDWTCADRIRRTESQHHQRQLWSQWGLLLQC